MKDLNLFNEAQIRARMVIIGSSDVERAVKETYGLDRTSIKLSSNDQVFTLIEKACEESANYINPSTRKLDEINDVAKENFGSGSIYSSNTHPMDAAYDLLKSANESVIKSDRRAIIQSHKQDEINSMSDAIQGSSNNLNSTKHSRAEISALLKDIYELRCPSGKSSSQSDPVNDIVKCFGSGRFSSDPIHTHSEWNTLINEILGKESDSFSSSTDIINDVAADQFGQERPSVTKMNQIQDKLMAATYELTYKLTPGSMAYNNKATEIDLLKEERKKLQDNLNELDK